MPRAAAVVFAALVGALEGARAFAPLPVVAALVPVLLGRLRVLPGFALRAGSRLFPLVAVPARALQLLAAVLGLGVGGAVVVVPPGAGAVAARAAARAGAVRARQAPPVVVAGKSKRTSVLRDPKLLEEIGVWPSGVNEGGQGMIGNLPCGRLGSVMWELRPFQPNCSGESLS